MIMIMRMTMTIMQAWIQDSVVQEPDQKPDPQTQDPDQASDS